MLNFNWWVNRKDPQGRNVFAGGFLGLDNIGVFDRSAQLPTGGSLEQADGTAWMAFFCQNMLEMALILAEKDPIYEEIAFKFLENFIWIAYAMDKIGEHGDDMWDEEDGFYYDVLRLPDGQAFRLKVRSMVGLLPLCASTVFEQDMVTTHPKLLELIALFTQAPPAGGRARGADDGGVHRLRRTPAAVAALEGEARAHPRVRARRAGVPRAARHPVALAPPRRAPVRLPHRRAGVSRRLPAGRIEQRDVRRQLELARAGLDAGQRADRPRAAQLLPVLRRRLHGRVPDRIRQPDDALRGGEGDLPRASPASSCATRAGAARSTAEAAKFQDDPHWRDLILFYEYFHGDNGAGLGASHQTGWTGVVARLMDLFARVDAADALQTPKDRLEARLVREQVGGQG